jgi:hypothetical protein
MPQRRGQAEGEVPGSVRVIKIIQQKRYFQMPERDNTLIFYQDIGNYRRNGIPRGNKFRFFYQMSDWQTI